MSTLPLVDKDSASNEVLDILANVEKKFGFIPNLMKVLASSPSAIKAYLTLAELLESTKFTPEEQQIMLLTVSRENKCEYCLAAHSMISAKMVGMDSDKLVSIRDDKPLADSKHQELVTFTSEIVKKRGFVGAEAVKQFKDAGYSDQHVLEVLLAVTMKTLSNYTNHLSQTPIDPQFAQFK